jgi:hypothetical protein
VSDLPTPPILTPTPDPSPKSPTKVLAFRIGLGFTVLGALLLETGFPGLILLALGILSLIFSGLFDRFRPQK